MRAFWVAVLIVESHSSDSRGSLISDGVKVSLHPTVKSRRAKE